MPLAFRECGKGVSSILFFAFSRGEVGVRGTGKYAFLSHRTTNPKTVRYGSEKCGSLPFPARSQPSYYGG